MLRRWRSRQQATLFFQKSPTFLLLLERYDICEALLGGLDLRRGEQGFPSAGLASAARMVGVPVGFRV